MEQTLVHMAQGAAWTFLIIFLFALVGVYATIRWIVGLFWKAEHAVEQGVENAERAITHHDR